MMTNQQFFKIGQMFKDKLTGDVSFDDVLGELGLVSFLHVYAVPMLPECYLW